MIELRHLRYFIAVAEALSFRRAAKRVHIDQMPLSRTFCDLEDQLGVRLFVRAPRRLHLTPAGLRLLKEARKVLLRVERARRAGRETDARFRAPLRIGVVDGIAQPKLTERIVRWREVAPESPLELTELRVFELAAALQLEELDAGFSFGLPDDPALTQQPAVELPRHGAAADPQLLSRWQAEAAQTSVEGAKENLKMIDVSFSVKNLHLIGPADFMSGLALSL